MANARRWDQAAAEHEQVVRGFLDALAAVPPQAWRQARAPGKWSPAALALHVCQAYRFGRDAARGGPGMRLKVPPLGAWLSRLTILPLCLGLQYFPRGADAPVEVVPDLVEAGQLTQQAAAERLRQIAAEATDALRHAATHQPDCRVTHAYFGALTPLTALRLLSAHTRHHTTGLRVTAREDAALV